MKKSKNLNGLIKELHGKKKRLHKLFKDQMSN